MERVVVSMSFLGTFISRQPRQVVKWRPGPFRSKSLSASDDIFSPLEALPKRGKLDLLPLRPIISRSAGWKIYTVESAKYEHQ